jgi:hypothetical protein
METKMSVRLPQISVDAMSYLKPELIGLAAWLGTSEVYGGDRAKVIAHVARTGVLDGLPAGLLREDQIADARIAHSEWQDFLASIDATPVRPLIPALRRNGLHLQLPPLSGGAPVTASAFIGHPAQEDDCGDDIAF